MPNVKRKTKKVAIQHRPTRHSKPASRELAVRPAPPTVSDAMAAVLLQGDLKDLTAPQKLEYHNLVCKSLGLNPLTRPFDYIAFQGKVVLYARRDCTEQLRKIHGVGVTASKRTMEGDLCIFEVTVMDKTGRVDTGTGAVTVSGLKGTDLANAIKKAETQAKRRATLSICGLGMIDESEIGDVGNAHPLTPAGRVVVDAQHQPDSHLSAFEQREQDQLAKLNPAQREIVKEKTAGKVSQVEGPATAEKRETGKHEASGAPATPAIDVPSRVVEPDKVIYYQWFQQSLTAKIVDSADTIKGLDQDMRTMFRKFWKASPINAIVLQSDPDVPAKDEFDLVKIECEKRGIKLQRRREPGE